MSEDDVEKWAREGRSKETARTSAPAPKQENTKVGPVPNDSSDEDDDYSDGELEKALLKIGLLKISDGKLMFNVNIPPYDSETGGIFIAQVVDEVEGEPPKKKRKPAPKQSKK